jgi:hypothetical protein
LLELYVLELLLTAAGASLLFGLLGYSIESHLSDPRGEAGARSGVDGPVGGETVEVE